jgi:ubiquinone/menaquinone biosynthesis C-methylase UbiE
MQTATPKALLTKLMMQAPYQPATNYWRAFEIGEVIEHGFPSGRGLDLGCGDGHLMGTILSFTGPRDLVGLDLDEQETAIARDRDIYTRVVTAPADHMPLQDSSFEYVFSNSVLEHIPNIAGVLGEVARVLRPGGRFLFTVPGPDFHSCLRGPQSGDREAYFRTVDARCAHLRYWSVAEWASSLQDAGLALSHSHEYLAEPQVQRWDAIARYTSGALMRVSMRKKRPIEIQRMLKIRSSRVRLPRPLASGVAGALHFGAARPASRFGCLLIEAQKP